MESIQGPLTADDGDSAGGHDSTGHRRRRTVANRYEREMDGRLEFNLAAAEIRSAFEDRLHQPFRISRRLEDTLEYIELSFISPAVGRRYERLIDELEEWTLWEIRIRDRFNLEAIFKAARRLLPQRFSIVQGPLLDAGDPSVLIRVVPDPEPAEIVSLRDAFEQATGLPLSITGQAR